MKNTGLYGVGLLVAAVSLMVSCGGDDGENEGNGGSSSGGSSAGKSTGGSGGSSSGGSKTGGSSSGGTTNNQGGEDDPGPGPGPGPQGGDGPGPGGPLEACGANVESGEACEQGEDTVCEAANGDVCVCFSLGQQDPEWNCDLGGGQGGAGPGIDMVDCGNNPMAGDTCQGFGLCEGSQSCACFLGTVTCI